MPPAGRATKRQAKSASPTRHLPTAEAPEPRTLPKAGVGRRHPPGTHFPQIAYRPTRPDTHRASPATRTKPQIRIFPNPPHEPRAGPAARAKSQIRKIPNPPHEPRASSAARAKPQFRIFAKQPTSADARHHRPAPDGAAANPRPVPATPELAPPQPVRPDTAARHRTDHPRPHPSHLLEIDPLHHRQPLQEPPQTIQRQLRRPQPHPLPPANNPRPPERHPIRVRDRQPHRPPQIDPVRPGIQLNQHRQRVRSPRAITRRPSHRPEARQ